MLKPGVLPRRLAGRVINRFEQKGLNIIALKMIKPAISLIEAHYREHKDRDYYEKLLEYTFSGPIIVMILEGKDAITLARRMAGPAKILESQPGTIRGDFASSVRLNIVHTSDSIENAERESSLFFTDDEILSWEDGNAKWF